MLGARMNSCLAFVKRNLLPVLVAFGAAFLAMRSDVGQRIENTTLDWRTRKRAAWAPRLPREDLLIIGIDEASLKEFKQWPWARSVHGDFHQLLSVVEPSPPSAIGWDILFTEPAAADDKFVAGIKLSGLDSVLGAAGVPELYGTKAADISSRAKLRPLTRVEGDRSKLVRAPEALLPAGDLAQIADAGFVDTPPGPDGVRRKLPLVVAIGDHIYPSLALQLLIRHWHSLPDQVQVRIGEAVTVETPTKTWRIPIDDTGSYLVNYRHGLEEVNVIGYSRVYSALHERYVQNLKRPRWCPPLSNRIVLVGQVATGLSDFGLTPFSPLTPLVLVHSNVIENVLREEHIRTLPFLPIWGGWFVFSCLCLAYFAERSLREQIVFFVGIPTVYTGAATLLWIHGSWLLPLVGPLLGFGMVQVYMIGRRVLLEQRAKEKVKGMFGTYVSPEVVGRMINAGEMPQLGGHEEEITAYFSDIQGYSTFSEKLPPAQLVELLNDYLTVCTDTITEEVGTLDKYIGDAVVAMFGAPIVVPDHAYRACVAALRVQQQLGVLRERWARDGDRWPEQVRKMQSRIGLNSGPAIIGNMGSRTRFNYTMTGDNVNLAARMESGAKQWGVYTMCTEATRIACEKYGGDRVLFRHLGRIQVVGRSAAVPVFEVVALKENATDQVRECLAGFDAALQKYYARDWHGALAGFEASAKLELNQPGKTPGVKENASLVYIKKARLSLVTPPPEDWDGVERMTEK